MMEDFNAMCAGIEAGLTAAQEQSTDTSGRLDQVRQEAAGRADADRAAAKEALYQGLAHLARNHYRALSLESELPWQIGVFRQKLDGDQLPAGTSGMRQLGRQAWVMGTPGSVTNDVVKEAITQVQKLQIVLHQLGECKPMILTFTAPGPGILENFYVSGTYNSGSGELRLKCVMQCLDTGEVVAEEEISSTFSSSSGVTGATFHPAACFHTGCRYQITVEPLTANANYGLSYSAASSSPVKVTPLPAVGPGTLTHTLQDQEDNRGGIALVRFQPCGAGGSFSLRWNGRTLTPAALRSITGPNGETLREAEFQYKDPLPAASTLTLTATPSAGGELGIFEWGAVLV